MWHETIKFCTKEAKKHPSQFCDQQWSTQGITQDWTEKSREREMKIYQKALTSHCKMQEIKQAGKRKGRRRDSQSEGTALFFCDQQTHCMLTNVLVKKT